MDNNVMREKPILFNTEMVQAVYAGRKTQTRRLNNFHEINKDPDRYIFQGLIRYEKILHASFRDKRNNNQIIIKCPFDVNQLWVRETFCRQMGGYIYKANPEDSKFKTFKWKPSIFMPRIASRIQLEITDIRVERVQDITEDDAMAEGIVHENAVSAFKCLWDSINEKRGFGWDKNLWVWVVEFGVIENNG